MRIGPPLDVFAARIARDNEYSQLVQALVEQGGDLTELLRAIREDRTGRDEYEEAQRKREDRDIVQGFENIVNVFGPTSHWALSYFSHNLQGQGN